MIKWEREKEEKSSYKKGEDVWRERRLRRMRALEWRKEKEKLLKISETEQGWWLTCLSLSSASGTAVVPRNLVVNHANMDATHILDQK